MKGRFNLILWCAGVAVITMTTMSCAQGTAQTRKNDNKNRDTASRDVNRYDEERADFNDAGSEGYSEKDNGDAYTESAYDKGEESEKFFQKGMASWYGREFHGKETASGEPFDMYKFTAAHKTLPFGTIIKVKNLDNGKVVHVKINDRGPYRANRILDLSYNAAKRLEMIEKGNVQVGIVIVRKGDVTQAQNRNEEESEVEPVVDERRNSVDEYADKEGEEDAEPGYDGHESARKLQVGAFYSRKNAENHKKIVEELVNSPVKVVRENDLYKVRVEKIGSMKELHRYKKALENENIQAYELK